MFQQNRESSAGHETSNPSHALPTASTEDMLVSSENQLSPINNEGNSDPKTPGLVDEEASIFFPEETHLARALFRKWATETRDCTFQEGFLPLPEELQTTISLATPLQRERTGDGRSKLYLTLQSNTACRLLALEPACDGDPIRCSFVSIDLELDSPIYEAISYVWGNPTDKVEIFCEQESILIPRNLYDMLQRIRSTDRTRYVWADAICINQSDPEELGQQVSIMRLIFRNAKRVLVWLGKEDVGGKAHEAFTLVCTIIKHWHVPSTEDIHDGFVEYSNKISAATEGELDDLPPVSASTWNCLTLLYGLSWVERLWVLQEVTVASSVTMLWGDTHISWPLVGLASAWIMTKGYDMMRKRPIAVAYNAFLMYALPIAGQSAFKPLPFSVILELVRGSFQATNPYDRVFALLGQVAEDVDPDQRLFLEPNYTQSLASVYTDAARRILRQDRHLRILSAVQHAPEIDTTFPSWVPQWHKPSVENLGFRDEKSYYANFGELFDPGEDTFGVDPDTLVVHGIIYEKVSAVSDIMKEGHLGYKASGRFTEDFYQLLGDLASTEEEYRTTWSAEDEKFMLVRDDLPGDIDTSNYVFHPGKYSQREQVEAPKGHLSEYFLYWKERSSWNDTFHSDDENLMDWYRARAETPQGSEKCLGALYASHGRRVFKTEDGLAGLGPVAAQPGDYVCVLFGAIVPFVLRSRGDHWQLVGECFLPEIMKGQCVETARKGGCDRHNARFVLR